MPTDFLERRSCSDLSTNVAYQLTELARLVSSIYGIRYLHDLDQVALLFHVFELKFFVDEQPALVSEDQWIL
jgi:hypothetical protein